MTMKAIGIHEPGGPEVMRLEEVEKPVPQSAKVLIRTIAAFVQIPPRESS
jgi:NADPH:quinone reductase-like Zn-dependent oxidoreductase